MFNINIKKRLKELEIKKQEIEKEKQELLKIKEMLEEETPKIDITNVYSAKINGIKYFVRSSTDQVTAYSPFFGKNVPANHLVLCDIFSDNIVYDKTSTDSIKKLGEDVSLQRIYHEDINLLAYIDYQVPTYVLQQLYYKLNGIDLSSQTLVRK